MHFSKPNNQYCSGLSILLLSLVSPLMFWFLNLLSWVRVFKSNHWFFSKIISFQENPTVTAVNKLDKYRCWDESYFFPELWNRYYRSNQDLFLLTETVTSDRMQVFSSVQKLSLAQQLKQNQFCQKHIGIMGKCWILELFWFFFVIFQYKMLNINWFQLLQFLQLFPFHFWE